MVFFKGVACNDEIPRPCGALRSIPLGRNDRGEKAAPYQELDGFVDTVALFVPHGGDRVTIERRRREDAQRAEATLHGGVEPLVTHGEARFDALLACLAALQHFERGFGVEFFGQSGQIGGRIGNARDQFQRQRQAFGQVGDVTGGTVGILRLHGGRASTPLRSAQHAPAKPLRMLLCLNWP
jgi:hypothetical protein